MKQIKSAPKSRTGFRGAFFEKKSGVLEEGCFYGDEKTFRGNLLTFARKSSMIEFVITPQQKEAKSVFGWAFLGCGNIAAQVADEVIGEREMKIVSCWNRTLPRAEAFAEKYGSRAFASAEQAIAAEGVNAAYIAVTANKHLEYIRMCLSRGVPVLCEKPFTVNAAEAREAFALARERGVYLAEAMWTWYNAPAHTVRTWLREGRIGKVKRVTAKYAERYIDIPRFRSPELLGGALVDIGVYPLRYAYELFGSPHGVTCRGEVRGGVDITEEISLDYGEFCAEIYVSIEDARGEEFVIEGTQGTIRIPFFHMAGEASLEGREKAHFTDDSPKYGTELRRAAEEIAAGRTESGYCPPRATLDTMQLLDECRRQLGLVYPCEQ